MRDNSRYLKWCMKQPRGVRLAAPSQNLVKAYLEKSHSAFKSMQLNAQAGIIEWTVSASYYAKYFAVYALLSKIGAKCEIHDCTIALFEYLFAHVDSHHLVRELKQSKDDRIDAQYYSREIQVNLQQVMDQTRNFMLEIEKIIDSLTPGTIMSLQKKLRELVATQR